MDPEYCFDYATLRADAKTILHSLSLAQLQRGLRAFDHTPRNISFPQGKDRAGCFVYEVTGRAYIYSPEYRSLSMSYESDNEWFRGEVLRELAERGVVQEPAVVPQEVT